MIVVPGASLKGTVRLPGDKSISHRSALFAALAEGESRFENFLLAGVTKAMLDALGALGVAWSLDETTLVVQGQGLDGFLAPDAPIHCGNSGTTLRLLTGALAAARLPVRLTGSAGLRRRPMDRIVNPLQSMGVQIQGAEGNVAPLTLLKGPSYSGISYVLPVASAQVKSCLLLAGLGANTSTHLTEPGPSRDHTERMLASMGVDIKTRSFEDPQTGQPSYTTDLVPPNKPLQPINMAIPGDISSAAFLIVAALITPGSEIEILGVGLNPTRTGLLDALQQMRASIVIRNRDESQGEPFGDLLIRASELHGSEIGGELVVRMIDEFPAFAIAAAYANGPTIVRDAEELRYKESDRITALAEELQAVGVAVQEQPDGFVFSGQTPPTGGSSHSRGDHRLAMSLAIAGLAARDSVTILDPAIIHESFPSFQATLEYLGARID
jgi:3-phosphoshikimate 1-carboxyvinyltransferase